MYAIHSLADDGYRPGMIGRCASMMTRFYHDKFGFGAEFETYTAVALAGFVAAFEPASDGLWLVRRDDEIVGCIGIDGRERDARHGAAELRWFYLGASLRGYGLGRSLLGRAIGFARAAGYRALHLSTHEDLYAAVHLYQLHGFERTGYKSVTQWGRPITLVDFAFDLAASSAAADGEPVPIAAARFAAVRAAA